MGLLPQLCSVPGRDVYRLELPSGRLYRRIGKLVEGNDIAREHVERRGMFFFIIMVTLSTCF